MSYYYISSSLYHHGIKGQRWGVRRFQNKDGSLTPAGKKRYDDDGDQTKPDTAKKSKSKQSEDVNDPEAEAARKAKIKRNIKIGAAVAGTALATYGAYKMYDLYTGRKQDVDPATGFRLLNKDMSDMEHVNKINPGRIHFLNNRMKNKEIINGSSYNCMLCTTSYELRKRGYDVHAGLSTQGYTPDGLFSKIYKNYEGTKKIYSPESYLGYADNNKFLKGITNALESEGHGSRGNIVVWWKDNMGGHSMIWENDNGKIKFMDGQTGEEYKNFASEILSRVSMTKPVELLRTDNLDINIPEIKQVINKDTTFKTYVDHGAEIAVNLASDPDVQLVTSTAVVAAGYGVATYKSYKNNKALRQANKAIQQQTKKGGRK